MQPVADLLREALRSGDEQGRTQIRSRHLPDHVVADLAQQTYEYALEHASEGSGDGWLICRETIAPWWIEAADLTDDEFRRLYMLRADVVTRLTDQGLAHRRHPRPNLLYVRRDSA